MSRSTATLTLILLGVLGVATPLLLQRCLAPRISAEQRNVAARQLLDVLPAGSYDNQPLEQPLPLHDPRLEHSTLLGAWRASQGGSPSAVLLRMRVNGYAGPIELLVAIDSHGRLLASKTLKHSETPGLGARIGEQPNAWLQGFFGKSAKNPDETAWALNKDNRQFDQMAGATITSRAVVQGLHDALRYFDQHRQQLLGNQVHE